jgi:tetratricopeptide (TPR) repeat protein
VAEEAMERGARIGDRATEIQGKLARIIILVSTDPEMAFGEGRAEAERVLAEAQDTGDPATLARAWQVLGNLRFWAGDAAGGQAAGREGLAIAERAGLRDLTRELHWLEKSASVWGPVPVEEAIPWWEAVLGRDHDAQEELEANAALAVMWAMRGEKARALWYLDQAMRMLKDFGMKLTLNAAHPFAVVHLLLGDPGAAEAAVRPGIQVLQAMGESGFLSFSAALVAESVYRQGRFDEADEFTKLSEANVAEDDVDPQAAWRSVRAKVLARRGQFEEAERLAREAADIVRATDHSYPKGQVVFDLAEVLMLAANPDEALAAAGEALDLQDRKGDLASAARTKALIEQIERSG